MTATLIALSVMELLPRHSVTAGSLPRTALRGSVEFKHATVTASRSGGSSAITLAISNGLTGAINLLSVSSPVAKYNALHFDGNMCSGSSVMVLIPDLLDPAGRVLSLGLRGTGAMLMHVDRPLTRATTITLVVNWRAPGGDEQRSTVLATVVRPPRHLYFGSMASMRM